jgi:hypothetical protein
VKNLNENLQENNMPDGGKGSRPRPFSVSQEEFDNRWDNIFKKPKTGDTKDFDQKVIMKEEFYDLDDLNDPDRIGN